MTKEKIIIDMNVSEYDKEQVTLEDLDEGISVLLKLKLIKEYKSIDGPTWKRVFPKRSLKRKLLSFLKFYLY